MKPDLHSQQPMYNRQSYGTVVLPAYGQNFLANFSFPITVAFAYLICTIY